MNIVKPFDPNAAKSALQIVLCDTNADVIQAWGEHFGDLHAVQIAQGDLLDLESEAIVSPANSFGDMGGGLDKKIDDFFAGAAQKAAMAAIREKFYGELPVGVALILSMKHQRFPFLICAPTMRVPGRVESSLNAYLAMRAVLVAVLQHNAANARQIRQIAIPGLGTGVGGMSASDCAEQMRAAYDNILSGGWQKVVSPALAPFAYRPKS